MVAEFDLRERETERQRGCGIKFAIDFRPTIIYTAHRVCEYLLIFTLSSQKKEKLSLGPKN